jgi:SAM-dependent methyltransferase
MIDVGLRQKYRDPEVVGFWREMSIRGLQTVEARVLARYAPPGSRIVDLGCGAGRVALATDPIVYTVVGLDLVWEMVLTASELLRGVGRTPRVVQADLTSIPCRDRAFGVAVVFVASFQHVQGRAARQAALAEIARVLGPDGRFILAVDNLAPALACYGWWLARRLIPTRAARRAVAPEAAPTSADRRLSERPEHIGRGAWHVRGVMRTLRWRTWADVVDAVRIAGLAAGEPGDTRIEQVALPPTPGRVSYHLYRRRELIDDASRAGLHLVASHPGSELSQGDDDPIWIRSRHKQVFYVFRRG